MNLYLEKINSLSLEIEHGGDIASLKLEVARILIGAHSNLSPADFDVTLNLASKVFSSNCGCAEDLEKLEKILDELHELNILTSNQYHNIVTGTSCGRWL